MTTLMTTRKRSSLVPALLLLVTCTTTSDRAIAPPASDAVVRPGIETFLADVPAALRGKRVGLITNQSGIDRAGTSDIDLIAKHKDLKLVALLAPEHGIRGTVEAGETISDEVDSKTGVPIY